MHDRSQILASNLASVTVERKKRHTRALTTDRILQVLVADLVAARAAAGMTQEDVAARMWTTRSVVSRLESGVRTRPTETVAKLFSPGEMVLLVVTSDGLRAAEFLEREVKRA